jgi:hypothetical protein
MTMRDIIDGLTGSLKTIGAAGITGSEAMGAFARAHQLVGRLEAIHETRELEAAMESGQRVRYPKAAAMTPGGIVEGIDALRKIAGGAWDGYVVRPLVDTIDPDSIPHDSTVLTDEQITEAAAHAAVQRVLMPCSDDDDDVLDTLADELDAAVAAMTLPRIASTY